jgi:hypothetical protein
MTATLVSLSLLPVPALTDIAHRLTLHTHSRLLTHSRSLTHSRLLTLSRLLTHSRPLTHSRHLTLSRLHSRTHTRPPACRHQEERQPGPQRNSNRHIQEFYRCFKISVYRNGTCRVWQVGLAFERDRLHRGHHRRRCGALQERPSARPQPRRRARASPQAGAQRCLLVCFISICSSPHSPLLFLFVYFIFFSRCAMAMGIFFSLIFFCDFFPAHFYRLHCIMLPRCATCAAHDRCTTRSVRQQQGCLQSSSTSSAADRSSLSTDSRTLFSPSSSTTRTR